MSVLRKSKKPDGIYLMGKAAETVTGSMNLVVWGGYKILIECGLYMSNKNCYLEAYRVNTEKFDFNPADIDYIFVCHAHIDHTGLLPRLYKEGCRAQIIMRDETREVCHYLWANSADILQVESRRIGRSKGRVYEPVYTHENVSAAETYIKTYDECDKIYQLTPGIKFQWLKNGHCIGAVQLQLILTDALRTKRILYTSDMGKFKPDNAFVEPTEVPDFFNDYTIMETTNGDRRRSPKMSRKKEKEKLASIIGTTYERRGQVVIAACSYAKTQQVIIDTIDALKMLGVRIPIYVDSVLASDLSTKAYPNALRDDDLLYWREVLAYEDLKFIRKKEDSMACLADDSSKIVIAGSGFCTAGRVIDHLKKNVKNENSSIILSGYIGSNETFLSYRLWKNKKEKKIKIEGIEYPYRANLFTLETYSSHAHYADLIYYGSHIRTNKLVLVHGDMSVKEKLAEDLRNAISKEAKSHQVVVGKQGMFLPL